MGKCGCDESKDCDKEEFINKHNSKKNISESNENFNLLENLHLFGGAISQNICKDDDHSWYCGLSRTYSSAIMIIGLLILLFIVFNIFRMFIAPVTKSLSKKKIMKTKRHKNK